MDRDTPLYVKTFKNVSKEDGNCPEGTKEDGDVCVALPLELSNYNKDCSCKFGYTGATCETPRMMCLFDGEESDGTSCKCMDGNGNTNLKVNSKGCCTKGTYWTQERYRTFNLLLHADFGVIEKNELYEDALLQVCSPVVTEPSKREAVYRQQQYIATTDEYILEETSCTTALKIPLEVAVQRHPESPTGIVNTVPSGADPVQWCMQNCSVGFVLEGSNCNCKDELAFMDYNQTVFTKGLTGSGMRYDVIHPSSDCYKASNGALYKPELSNNTAYLEPTRFFSLKDPVVETFNTLAECFSSCLARSTSGDVYGVIYWKSQYADNCECGIVDDGDDFGYIIRKYEDNVYRYIDYDTVYENPKPCGIDTYLSYPYMDEECHCPIWQFDKVLVKDDNRVYSLPLDADRANLHSCVENCTQMNKRTARVERAETFDCFCGDTI